MSASAHRAIPGPQTAPQGVATVKAARRSEHGRELPGHAHSVQFYENDGFLAETVVDFFATGLVNGQRCVAIATPEHRAAFAAGLHAKGFDVERACTNGQLILLDANELLSAFMVGSLPDASRFRLAIGGVLGDARFVDGMPSNGSMLAFGEMVDVLWRQNNLEGAIRLEELWNELATVYSFSLLCAYSLNSFGQDSHDAPLRAICNQHSHVVPTERYMQMQEEARPREIALLQQRALALETELERRRELEESLREALRSAQAATRSKSEFLAVMSHELRTPLNAIGGHAQLLEMGLHGPVNDAQRAALTRVQRSQRHLLAMINDLLNLARCDTGQVEYVIDQVALAPVLDEVVSLLAPLACASGLSCTITSAEPEGVALSVQADVEKLNQILMNVVGNAIKFSTSGGEISVDFARCATDASLATIRVRDTGVGIPPAKLRSIFEPFVQLGGSISPQRDGVGLGLSISRSLARGMGGDLTVESEVGVGSTLTLTLPLA
ncbi:MAG: sensor protein [Gemmatimonadetes bacterium]|nr:sensor protein [Gemmatimonadota bacterium]